MDVALTVAFWGVSMLFVITPGVDWAYAISAGTRHRAAVVPAVTGMLAGHLTATVVVAAGTAAVLAASGFAMTVLTFAGAVYLVWLGVGSLRHPVFSRRFGKRLCGDRKAWARRSESAPRPAGVYPACTSSSVMAAVWRRMLGPASWTISALEMIRFRIDSAITASWRDLYQSSGSN